jgi:hypothetical protein
VIQFAQIELVFSANIHICIENFKYIRRTSGLKKNPAAQRIMKMTYNICEGDQEKYLKKS